MSNINLNNIDVTFPIAGQDNPSKGFRDNWSAIKSALDVAKSELTVLQDRSVLARSILNNTVVENNLGGSSIINGNFKQFYSVSNTATQPANTDIININITNGEIQEIKLIDAASINFTNWPSLGTTQYVKVRLHVYNNLTNVSLTVSNFTSSAGTVKKDDSFPTPFSVSASSHQVVDAWTFNAGVTVFLKYLGEF